MAHVEQEDAREHYEEIRAKLAASGLSAREAWRRLEQFCEEREPVCHCGSLIKDHHEGSSCTYAVPMEEPEPKP